MKALLLLLLCGCGPTLAPVPAQQAPTPVEAQAPVSPDGASMRGQSGPGFGTAPNPLDQCLAAECEAPATGPTASDPDPTVVFLTAMMRIRSMR